MNLKRESIILINDEVIYFNDITIYLLTNQKSVDEVVYIIKEYIFEKGKTHIDKHK